jgi:dihydroorotase
MSKWLSICVLVATMAAAQPRFDLLLKGGHVIDPKNNISAVRDVAISNGKIAAVAPNIAGTAALKTVDVTGLYVVPGLVDIHTHVLTMSGLRGSLIEDQNVWADSHTFRSGVTTVVDAGSSGWRNFPEQKSRVLDHSRTRILAMLNIVGHGQAGGEMEQDVNDMDPRATGEMAKRYPGIVVGIKTAHYRGPEWTPVDRAVEAGRLANIPVMVDFGTFRPERPYEELVLKHLRPGDISTHMYVPAAPLLDDHGRVRSYLFEARKRGVIFDLGHGGGSFLFRQAVPCIRQGFVPDSISTDLHTESMNAGMKDMLNVMSKLLNIGVGMDNLIAMASWHPAREIKRPDLGTLSPGVPGDVAVLRLESGHFGFVDSYGARMQGSQKLECELTLRDGLVVWDLNGITRTDWEKLGNYGRQQDTHWDSSFGLYQKRQSAREFVIGSHTRKRLSLRAKSLPGTTGAGFVPFRCPDTFRCLSS